jgi:hypothetical protein
LSLAARYHDLLTSDLADASQAQLDHALRRRGLVFGDRALCTVLRPRLMSMATYRGLQARIRPLMRAFGRAYERAMQDGEFRSLFGLSDWEETLITADPCAGPPSPTSRLDFFFAPASNALRLTEYNAETPAGPAFCDALTEAFLDLPIMREFARSHEVFPLPATSGVVGAILDAWHEFSGTRDLPRVAILDWRGVPTATEFDLFQEHFLAMGVECFIEDPRHAEYVNGRLHVGGTAVDVIYKRVLLSELVEQCGLDCAVVRAVRDRAVCMVDGFRCKILHKKASLGVLSDEDSAEMFDAAERAAIADTVPWTRVVRERRTRHDGRSVDLVPFIVRERERFVLKPNDDYGGRGITLGWTVDDSAWERAVAGALEAPFIVQERVEIPSEPYPSWVDGRVELLDRQYDTAPFITNGAYMEGLLTRLATTPLLNVTAGGGSTVPTFLVEPR